MLYSHSLSLLLIPFIIGSSLAENLSLTKQQNQKLEKLKEAVATLKFPHDWMKEDLNLVRYLRARNWDVNRAKDTMMETIKWWNEYGMDKIHAEDWTTYEKEFPIYIDGVDKKGQSLFVFSLGEWDLRQAAIQGKLKTVIRWLFKRREEISAKVREGRKLGTINGTQWNFILNLDEFNSHQHLCAQCLQIYTEWTTTYETHYPAGADKIILVNSPTAFDVVLTLVRPIFSAATQTALKVYGNNKAEWGPKLFAGINRDQLPETFGGTRKYTTEV